MAIMIKIFTNLVLLMSSIAASIGAFWFYNQFPAAWFRDYDFVEHERDLNHDSDIYKTRPNPPDPRMRKFPDGMWFCSILVFLFFILYLLHGFTLLLICNVLSVLLFSYIFVSDKKTQIIPDQFIFALLFISLLFMVNDLSYLPENGEVWYLGILMRLLGGFAGGLVLWLVGILGSAFLKQEAIGMGDVKLILACGVIVGINGVFWVLVLSFLLAFIPAIINILKLRGQSKNSQSDRLPFAPFIVISTTLYLMFSSEFLLIYYWYAQL